MNIPLPAYQLPIAVVTLAIGIVILGYAIWCLIVSIRILTWPSVEALIVSATIEEEYNEGVCYRSKITYRYLIDEHEFTSSRIRIGPERLSGSQKFPQKVIAKYPAGTRVRAWYSPKDPSRSVLERGANFSIVFLIFGAYVFIVSAWNWLIGAVILG